jgi:hypothetical protein
MLAFDLKSNNIYICHLKAACLKISQNIEENKICRYNTRNLKNVKFKD